MRPNRANRWEARWSVAALLAMLASGRKAAVWSPRLIALGFVTVGLANYTHAAGIFLPVSATVAPSEVSTSGQRAEILEAWERRVYIARDELAGARDEVEYGGAGNLLLNVRPGVDLDMLVERTAPTAWGYSLSGRIEGDTVGFVTLVVHAQAVAGSIWTPDASYEVVPLAGGVHIVRDVTNQPHPEHAGAVHPELTGSGETAQGGVDDGSVVDVLVVWTPARERGAGGQAHVKSQIDMAIAYTNDALERSGAFVTLNLVGAEIVDYVEGGSRTDLDRLVDPADEHMESVHALRDTVGADLVSLAVSYGGGRAQVGGSFSVAGRTPLTFAHEIGHNMWLRHDHFEAGPGGFGHGFSGLGISPTCIGTIMSYSNRCRALGQNLIVVPLYSSPWGYNPADGRPLGVSRFSKERGQDGQADAVLMVNRRRHHVANQRRSR